MSEEETSLDLYKTQLSQVELSLQENPSNEDLLELQRDLRQLISLTESSLLEKKKRELLKALEDASHEEEEEDHDSWEGRKCQAPFRLNGSESSSYHNGVVFAENDSSTVTVVFSNPCVNAMKPCIHYMNASCKFEGRCKYSHGEMVAKRDLREFKEPDFSLLSVWPSVSVLAKCPETDLWEHAKTLELSLDNKVLLEFSKGNDRVQNLPLELVFPLEVNEDQVHPSDSSDFPPIDLLDRIQGSASALGEWEKHTKGIGSKLMTKMGYIFGTGLGKTSQGIVEPVPCTLFPPGKSLDYCMEQRNRLKTLDTRAPKAQTEKKNSLPPKRNVFDFINQSIDHKSSASNESSYSFKPSQKSESDLKIENFKLAETIAKAEMEIVKLDKSRLRFLKSDPSSAKGLQAKINAKRAHLAVLKSNQRGIQKEQGSRSDRKKLSIF